MLTDRVRSWASLLKATPFHPQWLLRFGRSPDFLLALASGRTLDIGCADRWPESKLPAGCKYISLDYPITGHEIYGAKPDIFADAASLPLSSSSFDTVLLFEVLEHLERPNRALAETARVLCQGGKAIITIPFLYPMHDEPHDYQRYTRYGLIRECHAAGLRVDYIEASLGSAKTAGLAVNLALGGMLLQTMRKPSVTAFLAPFVLIAIPLINLAAMVTDWILPNWPAMTAGYQVVAFRL